MKTKRSGGGGEVTVGQVSLLSYAWEASMEGRDLGLREVQSQATKARPGRKTQIDTKGLFLCPPTPSPAKATARANKIHAAMSFNAAAAMAVSPTRVVKSLSSAKMQTRTGKAVMERDTPMNTRNWENPALSASSMVFRRSKATPMPQMKGTDMPAMAMLTAIRHYDVGSSLSRALCLRGTRKTEDQYGFEDWGAS
ncbi:hypothetical protein L3X38_016541 [Prunus dulcis]|uniref:Uncharacterized protein n=1 Tax=Prunus dulcis TaxID=3755 RepID=A0AAD4W7F3_PRUDU|nr:hypothetical protein L3X38_016541 [Prunus dulcis]